MLLREDFLAQRDVPLLAILRHEIPDVLGDVTVRGAKEIHHLRIHLVAGFQRGHHRVDDVVHELLIDRLHALGALLLPAVQGLDDAFEAVVQLLDHHLGCVLPFMRQGIELCGREELAFAHGADGVAARRADHHHLAGTRGVVQLAEELGLAALVFLLDVAHAAAVLVAAEDIRHAYQQTLDQFLHVVPQLRTAPCRQLQGARFGGVVEVVDVAPVRGRAAGAGLPREQLLYQRAFANAGRAGDVEVVALAGHADTELDGRHCPVLAGGGFEFFEFITARDAEPCRIGGRVQLFG